MSEEEITTGAHAAEAAEATPNKHENELAKSIDWKQGVLIAMGIPILILPSLYDLADSLWAMSVAVWTVSVLTGFLINFGIGELAATFGIAGIGGCAQFVFRNDEKYKNKRINWGRFIGAVGAWAYFSTWLPVIPIFTIMTGTYLYDFIPALHAVNLTVLNMVLGIAIFGFIILVGSKGLQGGAKVQLVLAMITIVPLLIIAIIPFFNGYFDLNMITSQWTPADWNWDSNGVLFLMGCMAVAQWSAVGWESCATYGSEYKNPSRDVPKALIVCGLLCLLMYFVVSFAVFGTLGITGIDEAGYSTLLPISEHEFGVVGAAVAMILLIAGMIMIIQTAFLDCARTTYVMAHDGNLPRFLGKTNTNGVPIYAMLFEAIVGLIMIPMGSPGAILCASSFGFSFAIGMASLAFIKARYDPRFKNVHRTWRAPRGWVGVSVFVVILEFFLYIPGLIVYGIQKFGMSAVLFGVGILVAYIPCWLILQWYDNKHPLKERSVSAMNN